MGNSPAGAPSKEDNEGDGGGGDSNGDCGSDGDNEDNGGNSASGGHKKQSTKYREENLAAKATAAVRR